MHIQKVLNSSVVLVQDDSGEESILLGKGIGYGRKAGEPIERQPSDRVFLPLSNPDAQPMLELFSSIPAVYLDLTQDIVDDAEQSLGVKLSAHIYLLLTDHLHFAVERQQKGLVVTNRIFWEIKHFYPKEYAVGQRGLQKVRAKLDIELPDEEAGNIAFHIVNARQDPQAGYDAMRAAWTPSSGKSSCIRCFSREHRPSFCWTRQTTGRRPCSAICGKSGTQWPKRSLTMRIRRGTIFRRRCICWECSARVEKQRSLSRSRSRPGG